MDTLKKCWVIKFCTKLNKKDHPCTLLLPGNCIMSPAVSMHLWVPAKPQHDKAVADTLHPQQTWFCFWGTRSYSKDAVLRAFITFWRTLYIFYIGIYIFLQEEQCRYREIICMLTLVSYPNYYQKTNVNLIWELIIFGLWETFWWDTSECF